MRTALLLLFLINSIFTFGQQKGMPYYRVYEPQEYQAHRQNWAIAQGENGVMHFANEGLLSFDGENWQLNMVPNQRHLRSLATGHDKIYVGGNNELGFFEKVGKRYEFTSLLQHVPDSLKNFDRVWTTLVDEENVYYQTDTFVLRISLEGKSKLWSFTKTNVWKLLRLNGKLHIDVPSKGFFVLNQEDEFELVPNGEILTRVGMEYFIPVKNGWLFEQRDTLKVFDGEKISIFKNDASGIFLKYGVDSALKIKSGDLVFSTRRKGGVVVLDESGNLKHHFTSNNGFSNEIIRNLFEDKDGSIWFALNTGISRLDLTSPLSFFTSEVGVNGTTHAIQSFNNKLYAGTTDGLKVSDGSLFKTVQNLTATIQDLDTLHNQLIIATSNDQLYYLNKENQLQIVLDDNGKNSDIYLKIIKPIEDKGSFICLLEEGIFLARWENGDWIIKNRLENAFLDAEEIVQAAPGELWVDTGVNGFYRVLYENLGVNGLGLQNAEVKNYHINKDETNGRNSLYTFFGEIVAETNDGFFTYERKKDVFENASNLLTLFDYPENDVVILDLKNNQQENVGWFEIKKNGKPLLLKIEKVASGFKYDEYPLDTYATKFGDLRGANTFYAEEEKVFYGGIKGMVEYKTLLAENISRRVNVFLSSMVTSDTIYYDVSSKTEIKKIKNNNSKLAFEYSSTSFKDAENKKYQYKLEGFDKEWSQPSSNNIKEYTSLPPGDYTFRVKAFNNYFFESPETTVKFTVNKPWYWNSISISLYILGLGIFTYLFSQWRNRNLKLKNLRLEEAVNSAVAETKRQAQEITELYEVKNQFFSNISHELRTPLTLILGPSTDMVEDENLTLKQKNELTFINNNAKRLLRLINQLLDLSKLEAGKLDLRASQQNIVNFVSTITESFDSMAVSRKIRLKFNSSLQELFVFFDQDKLEQILINLLSNALKFTKEGGKVTVSIDKKESHCEIEISDTGIGINEEQLPYVFDRFYQADNRESREHEGTGIGLSLTKELVELHGGRISASSKPSEGSSFLINLPLGKEHFEEHQLAKLKPVAKDVSVPKMEALIDENNSKAVESDDEVILLVEDNTEMRAYIKGLMHENYRICEAANGAEGYEIAKKEVPDLIISDVMMPKMDGTELCKKLKNNEITSHIPVILLTAKASEEDRIKGLNIEADAYLAKPFNKEELRARVNNLILSRKKLQKRFAQSTLISPKEIAITSMEEQFLEKLVDEIENNIGNEEYTVEQMAEAMNLSRSQLHRKLISITDQTPSLFIRKYRLERAKQLLEKGAGRVSDIAFQVGFSSPSYFTKCFVEAFGQTPKEASKSGD